MTNNGKIVISSIPTGMAIDDEKTKMAGTSSPFRVSRGKVQVLSPRDYRYARPSVRHLKEENDSNRKSWKSSVFGSLDVALGNSSNSSYNSSSNPNPLDLLDDSTLNGSISSFSSSKESSPTTSVKQKVTTTLLVSNNIHETEADDDDKNKERLNAGKHVIISSTKTTQKRPKRCLSAPNLRRFDSSKKEQVKAQKHSSSSSTRSPRRPKKSSSIIATSPSTTTRKRLTTPNNNDIQNDNDDDNNNKGALHHTSPTNVTLPNYLNETDGGGGDKVVSKGRLPEKESSSSVVVVETEKRNATRDKKSSKNPNKCSSQNNVVNEQEGKISSNIRNTEANKSKKLKEKKPKRCQSAPDIHVGDEKQKDVSPIVANEASSDGTSSGKTSSSKKPKNTTTASFDLNGKQKKEKKKEKKPKRHQSAPDIHVTGSSDSGTAISPKPKTDLNDNGDKIISVPIPPKGLTSSVVVVGPENLIQKSSEDDNSSSNRSKEIQSPKKQKKKKPNRCQSDPDIHTLEDESTTKKKKKQESRSISKSPKRKQTNKITNSRSNNNRPASSLFLTETAFSISPSVVSALAEKEGAKISNKIVFPAEEKTPNNAKNNNKKGEEKEPSKIESKTSSKKSRKKIEAKATTTVDEEGNKTTQQKVRSKKPKRCQSAPNIHLQNTKTEKKGRSSSKSPKRRKGSIVSCNKGPPTLRRSNKRSTIPNLDDDNNNIDLCTSHQNTTDETSKARKSIHAPSSKPSSSSRTTGKIKSGTAEVRNHHRSRKIMDEEDRQQESDSPLLSNNVGNVSTTSERIFPSAVLTVDKIDSDISNQQIPATKSPPPNEINKPSSIKTPLTPTKEIASYPLAPTTSTPPPVIMVDDDHDDGIGSSNIEPENKSSCYKGSQIQEIPSNSPDPAIATCDDEDIDEKKASSPLLKKVNKFRSGSPPPPNILDDDDEDNEGHDASIESPLLKKLHVFRSASPPPPKYIGNGCDDDDDASIDVLATNMAKLPIDAHPLTNPLDLSTSGCISAGESSCTSDLSFVLPIACHPEGTSSSRRRDEGSSFDESNRSIQFSDVVHAKNIPLLGEEDIERLYYSEQNLDDFRHEAFLESAGLNPRDFD